MQTAEQRAASEAVGASHASAPKQAAAGLMGGIAAGPLAGPWWSSVTGLVSALQALMPAPFVQVVIFFAVQPVRLFGAFLLAGVVQGAPATCSGLTAFLLPQ